MLAVTPFSRDNFYKIKHIFFYVYLGAHYSYAFDTVQQILINQTIVGLFFYQAARRENASFSDSWLDFWTVIIFSGLKPGQAHPLRSRVRRWTLFKNFVFPKVPKKCHKSLIFCCPIFVPIYISELNYEKKRKNMSYQWSFRTSSIPVIHSWN